MGDLLRRPLAELDACKSAAPLDGRRESLILFVFPASQEQDSIDCLPAKHRGLCKDSLEISVPYHFTIKHYGAL